MKVFPLSPMIEYCNESGSDLATSINPLTPVLHCFPIGITFLFAVLSSTVRRQWVNTRPSGIVTEIMKIDIMQVF